MGITRKRAYRTKSVSYIRIKHQAVIEKWQERSNRPFCSPDQKYMIYCCRIIIHNHNQDTPDEMIRRRFLA